MEVTQDLRRALPGTALGSLPRINLDRETSTVHNFRFRWPLADCSPPQIVYSSSGVIHWRHFWWREAGMILGKSGRASADFEDPPQTRNCRGQLRSLLLVSLRSSPPNPIGERSINRVLSSRHHTRRTNVCLQDPNEVWAPDADHLTNTPQDNPTAADPKQQGACGGPGRTQHGGFAGPRPGVSIPSPDCRSASSHLGPVPGMSMNSRGHNASFAE